MLGLLDCKLISLTGMYDLYLCTYEVFWFKVVVFPTRLANLCMLDFVLICKFVTLTSMICTRAYMGHFGAK